MLPCWTWPAQLNRMLSLPFTMGMVVCMRYRSTIQLCLSDLGPWTSKYAGENLHRRLAGEQAYQEKRYDVALKTAFLGTDEDLRDSMHTPSLHLSITSC